MLIKKIPGSRDSSFSFNEAKNAPTGAILEDVKLMRASVSAKMEVKSAGGVKNLDMLLAFMDAGVKRSGASAAAAMLDEFKERFGA